MEFHRPIANSIKTGNWIFWTIPLAIHLFVYLMILMSIIKSFRMYKRQTICHCRSAYRCWVSLASFSLCLTIDLFFLSFSAPLFPQNYEMFYDINVRCREGITPKFLDFRVLSPSLVNLCTLFTHSISVFLFHFFYHSTEGLTESFFGLRISKFSVKELG